MLLEKVLDVTLNVSNPINFCSDLPRHTLAALQKAYVGRCYKGAFISGVKKIIRTSAVTLCTTNTSGEGYIDVEFLADVVIFGKWDILVGVNIVSHQEMVVGLYEAPGASNEANRRAVAVVTILASPVAATIAVQQKIPVRVALAEHTPMQTHAAVVGTLLVCDQTAPAYRLRGALDAGARAELTPLLVAVDRELGLREELVRTRRPDLWLFELLLYRFRGTDRDAADQVYPSGGPGVPAWTGPGFTAAATQADQAGVERRNVLEIVRRALGGEAVQVSGIWSRTVDLYRSSPLVSWAPAEKAPDTWRPLVDGLPRAVFAEFLKNILDFLTATREMAEMYNTRELISSHRNVWAAMRSAQLQFEK